MFSTITGCLLDLTFLRNCRPIFPTGTCGQQLPKPAAVKAAPTEEQIKKLQARYFEKMRNIWFDYYAEYSQLWGNDVSTLNTLSPAKILEQFGRVLESYDPPDLPEHKKVKAGITYGDYKRQRDPQGGFQMSDDQQGGPKRPRANNDGDNGWGDDENTPVLTTNTFNNNNNDDGWGNQSDGKRTPRNDIWSNSGDRESSFRGRGSSRGRGDGVREPRKSRPGDWKCSACGQDNFASRTECFKCSADKGDSEVVPGFTGRGEGSRGRGDGFRGRGDGFRGRGGSFRGRRYSSFTGGNSDNGWGAPANKVEGNSDWSDEEGTPAKPKAGNISQGDEDGWGDTAVTEKKTEKIAKEASDWDDEPPTTQAQANHFDMTQTTQDSSAWVIDTQAGSQMEISTAGVNDEGWE